jgi:hypothetical protein
MTSYDIANNHALYFKRLLVSCRHRNNSIYKGTIEYMSINDLKDIKSDYEDITIINNYKETTPCQTTP